MRKISGIAVLLCLGAAVAAEAQMHVRRGNGVHHGNRAAPILRHHFVHRQGIDALYAQKTSPLAPTDEEVGSGQVLFQRNCASCHGMTGIGDGEAGAALDPPPADLVWASRLPIASDAYLYWTIAEGGAPVGSAMPAFKAALGENEIWQIVAYLRTL